MGRILSGGAAPHAGGRRLLQTVPASGDRDEARQKGCGPAWKLNCSGRALKEQRGDTRVLRHSNGGPPATRVCPSLRPLYAKFYPINLKAPPTPRPSAQMHKGRPCLGERFGGRKGEKVCKLHLDGGHEAQGTPESRDRPGMSLKCFQRWFERTVILRKAPTLARLLAVGDFRRSGPE